MKKSSQVPATLVIALAATVTAAGCGSSYSEDQCMDSRGYYLPDSACNYGSTPGAHWGSVSRGGFGSSGGYGGSFGG